MQQTLLTPAEFARLARTTKRTVLWYAEKGILLPHSTTAAGYRMYLPEQIIDFQSVLLMRKLGVSLADIKTRMSGGASLQDLFEQQRSTIEQQIGNLQRMLTATSHYYDNLTATGTLVQPVVKQTEAFDIYYINRQGPYANIKKYADELQDMFFRIPADTRRLTIFVDQGYLPQNATMKIGICHRQGLEPKTNAQLQYETVPAYKALSYVHHGSSTLLSLLWQEVGRYRQMHHLALAKGLPFASLEFYQMDTAPFVDPDDTLITEISLPIR